MNAVLETVMYAMLSTVDHLFTYNTILRTMILLL